MFRYRKSSSNRSVHWLSRAGVYHNYAAARRFGLVSELGMYSGGFIDCHHGAESRSQDRLGSWRERIRVQWKRWAPCPGHQESRLRRRAGNTQLRHCRRPEFAFDGGRLDRRDRRERSVGERPDNEWSGRLAERLPGAEWGDIVTVEHPMLRPIHKRHLNMAQRLGRGHESFQAAVLSDELGIPFAAVRVVADAANQNLPSAATHGLRPDGSVAVGAVVRSLLQKPSQIPSLVSVTVDALIAFRALLRGRERLGPHFASLLVPELPGQQLRGRAYGTPESLDADSLCVAGRVRFMI